MRGVGLIVNLNWSPSSDGSIVGYHVYRCASRGLVHAHHGEPRGGTSYSDTTPAANTYSYLVRAIKLESCSSGTYYNPSQGAMATVTTGSGGGGTRFRRYLSGDRHAESGQRGPDRCVHMQRLRYRRDALTLFLELRRRQFRLRRQREPFVFDAGTYTATVTVSDGHGNSVSSSVNVTNQQFFRRRPGVTTPCKPGRATIRIADLNSEQHLSAPAPGCSGQACSGVVTTGPPPEELLSSRLRCC